MERDAHATFSYASDGPVITIDPIAANSCARFLPFCEALVRHLEGTVGGLKCAFNQSIGVPPRAMGRAVRANPGARDFLKRREQCDPEGRFLNGFWEEVLKGGGEGTLSRAGPRGPGGAEGVPLCLTLGPRHEISRTAIVFRLRCL